MRETFLQWADIFGIRPLAAPTDKAPEVGDVFVHRPEYGPIEYAQVIGVYVEAADIQHVRFRLVYGYKDKTAELGERTLAASLFHKHYTLYPQQEAAAE